MSALCSIDLSVLNTRFPTGISRYTQKIVEGLLAIDQDETRWLTLGSMESVGLPDRIEHHLAYELPLHNLDATSQKLSAILYLEGVSAHFSPYYPLPQRTEIPTFLTIFDLLPLKHPEWFPNEASRLFFDVPLRESAKRANHLFTISEATKTDLIEIYQVPPEKIIVTPLAPVIDPMSFPESGRPIDDPFFICVSTIEPRKNLERTLLAFQALLDQNPDLPHKLVIVGAYGWKSENLQKKAKPLGNRVIWTGYLSDSILASWYRNAEALIFVSLAEGFGIPILEAMSCGVPVLTSNCSSMPEVGGDAAVYCEPTSIQSILSSWKLLTNQELRNDLALKCRKRAKRFSWEKAALETFSVIEENITELIQK